MSQITQEECGNRQYIHCEIENHKCVHCGKFHDVNEGDFVDFKCQECGALGMIQVATAFKSGDFYGYCKKCSKLRKSIESVCEKFFGEWVYYDEETHYKGKEYEKRLDGLIDEISSLPKEELKLFLKYAHDAVER